MRGVDVDGDRRQNTARLRENVLQELRNPNANQMYSVGLPSNEIQYIEENVTRLKKLLAEATLDTHERFMSVFIHIESRLNRIPRDTRTESILPRIRAMT